MAGCNQSGKSGRGITIPENTTTLAKVRLAMPSPEMVHSKEMLSKVEIALLNRIASRVANIHAAAAIQLAGS